ncbi:hypothetical protein PITC_052140 [Penicillium italicum]|uniref:Uncharacterized protein n=1 Tax=Penicillium italicum TaxID=40296 RepID=A0A0A2KDY3_PENIT|nr:hypothetical protein PITC_052140 [Penicillium italicum]
MVKRMRKVSDPEILSKVLSHELRPGRRLTPGDGNLEALSDENATLTFDPIQRITEQGIKASTGDEKQLDVMLIDRHEATLEERCKGNPESFLVVQVITIINYYIFNGPSCISYGSVLHFEDGLENNGGEHFHIDYRSKNRFRCLPR